MGIHSSANIGYGFKVSDPEMIEKLYENYSLDLFGSSRVLDYIQGGYAESDCETLFICITTSCKKVYDYDDNNYPIENNFFHINADWNDILKTFAKENDISIDNIEIGWWLTVSIC